MISLEEALRLILSNKSDWGTETVSLGQSLGRILSENVTADRDYPPFNRSTMDGFALRTDDILEKHLSVFNVIGELFAGDNTSFSIFPGQALKIMTGAPVPPSADIVIRNEDAQRSGDQVVFNSKEIKPFHNIARQGEDTKKGAVVIPKHSAIRFGTLSVLASLGKADVKVRCLPNVAVFSTGNEIRSVSDKIDSHHIRDSNSVSIEGFLQMYSIFPVMKKIIPDETAALESAIRSAVDYDILIISGGVSAGEKDLVPAALKECGVKEVFHTVKIKPGRPLWFGRHVGGLRVFGLPGNQFSVQVACKIFIEPFLRTSFQLQPIQPLMLPLAGPRKKKTQLDEYFPASLKNGMTSMIEPLTFNTSGDITAVLKGEGICRHPASASDLTEGKIVEFLPWMNLL